jgi:2-phospho-L-lactate guanylyltransferase (CobY/MobA/RfbA family)
MSRVTAVTAKFELDVPVNLNILFSQKINKSSRKTFSCVIVSSTLILPAPLPLLKPSSLNGSLNTTYWGVVDLPA